jgi:hypothetical protein
MYIDFVDLPPVPGELLESYDDIVSKPNLPVSNYQGKVSQIVSIQRRAITDELVIWLQSVCKFPVTSAQYLLISYQSPIHRDPPSRPQSYNYIIHAGGPIVKTTVYNDNYSILKSMVIPEKQWHCLDTGKLHGVRGILKTNWRILLSVDYNAGTVL